MFHSKEFFTLAEDLAGQNNGEAKLRTAVGRAYYACFLQAREKIHITGRRRIHRKVISELKRRDLAAGNQLDKLETLRGTADYEVVVSDPLHRNWHSNWETAWRFAIHLLRRIDRLK